MDTQAGKEIKEKGKPEAATAEGALQAPVPAAAFAAVEKKAAAFNEALSSKPAISYDDFSKLDLRVAKILEAEAVEGSDKLLKLKIRVGTEERTLVAGIGQHYAPDEVLGKKIIIIANLEPRKIKGIESQGMLLAAAQEEAGKLVKLCLATVDDPDFPDGPSLS
jgi:methionine--tRNA ligase beta chain